MRGIYDIAAQLYGLNTEVLGAVPFSAAIASHLTAGVGGLFPVSGALVVMNRFPVK